MAIRINLLAEQQLAQEMRMRDPVKRAVWLAGFAVAVVLIWSLGIWLKCWAAESEAASLDMRWHSLEATNGNVTTNLNRMREITQKLDSLNDLATNRMLWGSFLDALQFSTVENVQLVSLRTKQIYVLTPAVKAKEGSKGKPATSRENISLVIDARDYGPSSGETIDIFKKKMLDNSLLKNYLTNENCLRLTARVQPQNDPAEPGRTFVLFTLEGQFPEVLR
jgi:hypothetical protein